MRHAQRLQVGVGHYELDALHAGINHAIDCVVAASTHTDNLDLGVVAGLFVKADANVVFFFHLRRPSLKFGFSFFSSASLAPPWRALRLKTRNRKVRKGLAKFAETCPTYAPFPTNIAFSFELQPSPCIPRAMRARCPQKIIPMTVAYSGSAGTPGIFA